MTPSANGCTGPSKTFNITVNPTPGVDAISNQVLCNGASTASVNFTGAVSGSGFIWVNTAPSIGLAATGVGNIASFIATNTTNAPVIATITVTPSANSCTGPAKNFTITVNPTPTVDAIADKVVCNGGTVAAVAPAGPVTGTTFAWVNTDPSIGLAANGSSNIPAFAAVNTTANPVIATVTITPTANGCVGIQNSYDITVNPTPMLSSTLTPPAICDSAQFSYTPTSATAGTAFAWSRVAVAGIANAAASGTNNPNEALVNTTPNPVTVTYVYTLTANACPNTQNVTVTVNPTPKLSTPLTDSVCSEGLFTYTPVSATSGTNFAWVRAAVGGITPATGSGTGNISETLVNSTSAGINVNYVYTLTANGCVNTQTLAVMVNSKPAIPEISIMPPTTLCDNTMYQNFGTLSPAANGASYTWTADNAIVWASGANNENCIVNFTEPGTAVITLTSSYPASGCTSSASFTATVGSDVSDEPQVIYYNGRFVCLLNNADSYRWGYDDKSTLDSNIISGQTNQDYFNTTPDLVNRYYWVMTTKDGCMQKSYYNKPTGIHTIASENMLVKLYPNPAVDKVNIELSEFNTIHASVKLFDVTGKNLKSANVSGVKTQLDVSDLTQGIYFIGYYENGVRLATLRFIKN